MNDPVERGNCQPVWCFEIGKSAPEVDYEHLISPTAASAGAAALHEFLWTLFSRVKDGILASGQPALVYFPLPEGLVSGRKGALSRFELARLGETEFTRMQTLVLNLAALVPLPHASPLPASSRLWPELLRLRPGWMPIPPALTTPAAPGEIRVCGLAQTLLTAGATPRTVRGLAPFAAEGALRAALGELTVEQRFQAGFALNVVPDDPISEYLRVVFPPLPLAPAMEGPPPPDSAPVPTEQAHSGWLRHIVTRLRG